MSQVQFLGYWSQNSGFQGRKSKVPGSIFQVPGYRGLMSQGCESQVPGSKFQNSGFQGPMSQGPRVPGPRVPGSGSQVLILEYACWLSVNWLLFPLCNCRF